MSDPDDGAFSVLPALRAMGEAYRFCSRCWMPLAPVRRCRCAPEPYPDGATPARVIGEHPRLRQMAAAVASGRYADDTATREQRWLAFLLWLLDHDRFEEWVVVRPATEEATKDRDAPNRASPVAVGQSNHTSQVQPNNS